MIHQQSYSDLPPDTAEDLIKTMITIAARRAAARSARASAPRAFLSSAANDPHVAGSPFPPLDLSSPNLPLSDFVTQEWASFGDKTAITDGITGDTRTFAELHADVASVAAGLQDMGIGRGSIVGFQSPNHVDYGTVVLAAARLGAALTPARRDRALHCTATAVPYGLDSHSC